MGGEGRGYNRVLGSIVVNGLKGTNWGVKEKGLEEQGNRVCLRLC